MQKKIRKDFDNHLTCNILKYQPKQRILKMNTIKEIKIQHIIIDNCDCDSGINVKGIKSQLDIDMSEKAIGGVISSLIKKGHIMEDDEFAGVFTASESPYYFLSDELTDEEIEALKIK
jgi:hypothetical protein